MYLSEKAFPGGTYICPRKMEDEHENFHERLRKTFYYGNLPGTERPSLPVTDLLVNFYNESAPRELGKLDNYLAASMSRSACISPSSVAVGMMYVKRLKKRQPEYLTQVSSSELFIISMMMASKFLYDEGVDEEVFNDEWATSGDLDKEDINQLELDFLAAIDWHLFIRPEEFDDMLYRIEKRIALQQGLHRGWFSYTDLLVLSHDLKFMNWNDLVSELSTVFSAASLAYVAGILTMIGSTMLGTTASMTLMKAGSQVLPLCSKTQPMLALYPELSLEVVSSRSSVDVPGSEVRDIIGSELFDTEAEQTEQFRDQSQNYTGNHGDEEMEEVTSDQAFELNTRTHHISQQKEQTGLLNGFLPPFLALVTLKDTLLNFAYGTSLSDEQNNLADQNNREYGDMTLPSEEAEFCSSGPCLIDSWSNCWNVSMKTDWTSHGSQTGCSYLENERCCKQCMSDSIMNKRHGLDNEWLKGAEVVHCCCLGNTGNSWLKGSLYSGIMDINLRFDTRSVYPVFVTT